MLEARDSFSRTAKAREEALKKEAEELRNKAQGSQAESTLEQMKQAEESAEKQPEIVAQSELKSGEYSGKGEKIDVSGVELEEPIEELPDEAIEELPEMKQESTKKATIATAYGGHTAAEAAGGKKEKAEQARVGKINEAAMEKNLRERATAQVRAKIEAGAEPNDLMQIVEGQLEELSYDIDDLEEEGGQEVILKEKYLERSKLDAQRSALLEAGAVSEKEPTEVTAKEKQDTDQAA